MRKSGVVVVFASSKGGAGKTTAAIVLGDELARAGRVVRWIDADPNAHLAQWARRAGCEGMVDRAGEESVLDVIQAAARRADHVLVDLEGTASNAVTYAVSQAQLVIIPAQPSAFDLTEAVRAVALIARTEAVVQRTIPHRILLSKTPVLATRTAAHARVELERLGAPVFGTELMERVAFKELTLTGQTPGQVEPASSAARNVMALAAEVLEVLMSGSR
jgi:chromosome partitioning protein